MDIIIIWVSYYTVLNDNLHFLVFLCHACNGYSHGIYLYYKVSKQMPQWLSYLTSLGHLRDTWSLWSHKRYLFFPSTESKCIISLLRMFRERL